MATGRAKHAQAEQHDDAAEHLTERRDGGHIAIADRGEGLERPPGRGGDAAEVLGLRVPLEEVDHGGREQEQHHHQKKGAEQCAPFMRHHSFQRLQRRRVAHELEQPEQPQHPQHPEIDGHDRVDVPRQNGEQVDDHHRPHREFEPRAPMRQMVQQRNLNRAPQPQHIFDGEDHHRERVEGVELRSPARIDGIDRLRRKGDAVGDDQRDEKAVDDAAGGMGVAAHFEDVVNLQPPAAPDGHETHGQACPARCFAAA